MAMISSNPDPALLQEAEEAVDEVVIELEEEDPFMEVELEEEPIDFYENVAETLPQDVLDKLASEVISALQDDMESRRPWETTIKKGLDLLGLEIKESGGTFDGACTAVHPLIMETAVKFQAKASQELLPSKGPVQAQVIGKKTPEKEAKAVRIKDYMNYQLTEVMDGYYDDFESMLLYVPIVGSAFRKVHWDEKTGSPVSEYLGIDQFVVSNYARDLRNLPRYTHIIHFSKDDLHKEIYSGFYSPIELGSPSKVQDDSIAFKMYETFGVGTGYSLKDEVYEVLEQHVEMDLEDDLVGFGPRPYIITVLRNTQQVLSIRRNWEDGDTTYAKKDYFVHYKFVPGFGFYGLGFIHLLGNFQLALTAIMRSLVDAGQFANMPGGFKAKGFSVVGSDDPLAPGEWRDVEARNMDLSKALVPLPYKEPSRTLMEMLNFIDNRGQRFADSTEQVISDATNYGPVGTTMALIEQSTKFFSGVHKRMHAAQRAEFKILARLNGDFLPDTYPYEVPNGEKVIARMDFDGEVDILPVADPNITSKAERLSKAHMIFTFAMQQPQHHNMPEILRRIYSAMDEDQIEDIMAPKQEPKPQDPLSDIMTASKGMPIKAFQGQNHDAHIKVKMAWLEDPTGGKNQTMGPLLPIIQSNVQEHLIMRWQEQLGGMVSGAATDPATMEMVMAEAAEEVVAYNKSIAEESPTEAELEARGLDIKESDLQRKWVETLGKLSSEDQKLAIEAMKTAISSKEVDFQGMKNLLDAQNNRKGQT